MDVNILLPVIHDESWEEGLTRIDDVEVFLSPGRYFSLKLPSTGQKGKKDVSVALKLGRDKINFYKLRNKAERAGILRKLVKTAKNMV